MNEFLIEVAKRGGSWAYSQLDRIRGAETELKKLNNTAQRIHARLRGAEECRVIDDESTRHWLRELKAVALDAEDLDDQFRTLNSLATKAKHAGSSSRKRKRPGLDSCSSWVASLLNSCLGGAPDLATKVEEIRKRYEVISNERKDLVFSKGETRRRALPAKAGPQNNCGSLQDPSQIFGRDSEADEIIRVLRSGGGSIPSVIAIVGAGGLGKTALAQKIYGDERVKWHFHLRAWVCLSQEPNLMQTTKEIIESLTRNHCRLSSLDAMQQQLLQLVTGQRILLVLDNVWIDRSDILDNLRLPFTGAQDGSKILITTRNTSVSCNMRADHCHKLAGLEDEYCWLLFQDRAFVRGEARRVLEDNPNLEDIGREIVHKCHGSPLAVRAIASLLHQTEEDNWQAVLDDMPDIGDFADTILPTLKVSYDYLSLELRRCFEICSIFPKGHRFNKDELARLWMAVGFIRASNERIPLENIGGRYFNNLLARSFFQPCDENLKHNQEYRMPSMIHELAQRVSKYECWRSEQDMVVYGVLKWARHALCMEPTKFEKIGESKNLRTLVLRCANGIRNSAKQDLLERSENLIFLRVLDLSNSQLEVWPDSINGLILLRYLSMSGTKIREVPESVGDFHHLQTLDLGKCNQLQKISESIGELEHLRYLELGGCHMLVELPKGITKLVKLRYLGMHLEWENWDGENDLLAVPSGIGKLTSLQTLSRFTVGLDSECGIRELKDLNKIRGELCISKLENIVNVEDAGVASLQKKNGIEFLMLRWSNGACSSSHQEEVIRCLRPHNNLTCLWIENYSGFNFPSWIADSAYRKLEKLRLSGCQKCRVIPFLDQLTHLSELVLSNCHALEELTYLPPSLQKFEVRKCPKLGALPTVHTLRDLEVEGGSGAIFNWIKTLDSLSSLTVSHFSGLEHLHGTTFRRLTSLTALKVKGCEELFSLGQNGGLTGLTSLVYLEISSCPKLSILSDQGLPAALRDLQLQHCYSLKSLPQGLHHLASLRCMEIDSVPKLMSMPELPAGLQYLTIKDCDILQQRCQIDGEDWPRVQHIPNLNTY